MNGQVKYRLYPSILDSYSYYLNSEDIYLRYWGNSPTPSKTLEEFENEQFKKLITSINRTPIPWEETEKMDLGTTFNEIVDCIIAGENSKEMSISTDKENGVIIAEYNNRTFQFPIKVCREFAEYFKGAQSQIRVSAILPTKYGYVEIYGVIDELMPTCVHDIKTTGSYEAWKYKDYAQRLVYPYCLNENGCKVDQFEFNVLVIKENSYGANYESLTEFYNYDHESDTEILRDKVEEFIEFLESNRELISNRKIFNEV